MTGPFLAYRIDRSHGKVRGRLEHLRLEDISPGDILVRVRYSDINYKDALAATGTAPILKRYPLVGGIDLAGDVVESVDSRFAPGDQVLVINCGLSETRDGGYAEYARINGDCPMLIPQGLDARSAMALGTAGFTAALAIHRMETNGQRPEQGPIVVTGATGGVGSLAIDMLSERGYEVLALTAKTAARGYLQKLGASGILDRHALNLGTKPLEHGQWGGAVDSLGGEILSWLIRTVRPWGNIASVGLAASSELHTSIMPFILRSVSLLGVYMGVPEALRTEIWNRLAGDLKPRHLEEIVTREVPLTALPTAFDAFITGQVTGRTVVKVS